MKRTLLGFWLILFAVWPAIHYRLVTAYDLDPARFAGWATLAAPRFPATVVLFRIEMRGAETVDDIQAAKVTPERWSDDLRRELRRYETARGDFGQLAAPPERLGRKLLAEHGETGMVLVAVQTRTLNSATGLMQAEIEKYVYSDRDKVRAELHGGTPP